MYDKANRREPQDVPRYGTYGNAGNWLFGVLLDSLFVLRFCTRIAGSWPAGLAELRRFLRDVSRLVYLALYSVV